MKVREAILGLPLSEVRKGRASGLKRLLLTHNRWILYSDPNYEIWLSADEEARGIGQESVWTGDNPDRPVFGFKTPNRTHAYTLERLTDAIMFDMPAQEGRAAATAISAWIEKQLAALPGEPGEWQHDVALKAYVNALCYLNPAAAMRHIGPDFNGYGVNWTESLMPQSHIALIRASVAPAGSLAAFQRQPPEVVLEADEIVLMFNAIDLPEYFPPAGRDLARTILVEDDLPPQWDADYDFNRDMLGLVDNDSWDDIRRVLSQFRIESPQGGWVSARDAVSILSNTELVDWLETLPQGEPIRAAVATAYGHAYEQEKLKAAQSAYLDELRTFFDSKNLPFQEENRYGFRVSYPDMIGHLEEYAQQTGEPFTGDLRDLNRELGYKVAVPDPAQFDIVHLDSEEFNRLLGYYLQDVRPDYDDQQKEFKFDEPQPNA